MTDIYAIPDNCMVRIFSNLPLLDVLRCSQVSQRWMFIREVICEKIISLSIRGNHNFCWDNYDKLRFFDLKESHFDLIAPTKSKSIKFWKKLVNIFPNVKKLTLFECPINEAQLSILLKSKWLQQLTHLKLILNDEDELDVMDDASIRFINDLLMDGMPSLKHFSLHKNQFDISSISILPQVDEIFYTLQNFPDDILTSLKRHEIQINNENAVCNLKRFGIFVSELSEQYQDDNDEDLESAFDQLFNQNFAYANMLTHLTISEFSIDLPVLQLICSKFPSITYLDFNLEHPDLFDEQIWISLFQLKQLSCLSIKADENYQQPVIPINIDNERLPRFENLTKGVRLLNCHRIHPHQYSRIESLFPNSSCITIQFSPRYFFEQDERYRQMKLCYFCSTCLKLRKTLPPTRFSIKHYNPILILLDIKKGSIQNVDIQIDPAEG